MKEIRLKESRIVFGEYLFHLERFLGKKKSVFIFDENVWKIYGRSLDTPYVIRIEGREKNKSLKTIQDIYRKLLKFETDRDTWLIGVGGGVILDITGFVGSTFMRGISFGFVPTSLLAQVDASIGGKNGVNFSGIKNVIGTVTQPSFVVIDPKFLETLPHEEWENGFAEIIKHGIIGNRTLFETLEHLPLPELKDKELLRDIIYESLLVKSAIVEKDEKDNGERKKLNFGHTFGHAIETTCNLSHGRAISVGMLLELKFSLKWGVLSPEEASKIKKVLDKFGLPVDFKPSFRKIVRRIKADKKRENDLITIVLIERIGCSKLEKVKLKALEEVFDGLCKHRRCIY
ncbi:MAG: 3-dehydroquinate synthase [Deltaproteobacteria bacterium]|nr:3-dehydroquinate synthase [Deltaproteobacteria bacterium]